MATMTHITTRHREILIRFDPSDKVVALLDDGVLHEVRPMHTCCDVREEVFVGDVGDDSHPSNHHQAPNTSEGRKLLMRQLANGHVVLFLLILLECAVEFVWFRRDLELLDRYALWIFYLDVTVVSLATTIGYLRTYRYAKTNHMTGMMIGMTVGMQVGMMTGGVVGATDGYFLGAVIGVLLGTFFGVATSWCCGPMAITQGLMSGVMGGTMGSMIIAMMPSEKLAFFMPMFTLLNLSILGWFVYLFFRDCVVGEHCPVLSPMSLGTLFLTSSVAVTVLTVLMVLGPQAQMF